jgi:hypothetical protein
MKMTKAGKYIEDQVLSSRCLKPWINAAVHEYSIDHDLSQPVRPLQVKRPLSSFTSEHIHVACEPNLLR